MIRQPRPGHRPAAEDKQQRREQGPHGKAAVQQIIAAGGLISGQGGDHGVGEIGVAAAAVPVMRQARTSRTGVPMPLAKIR